MSVLGISDNANGHLFPTYRLRPAMMRLIKSQAPFGANQDGALALCEVQRMIVSRLVRIWYAQFQLADEKVLASGAFEPPSHHFNAASLDWCIADLRLVYPDLGHSAEGFVRAVTNQDAAPDHLIAKHPLMISRLIHKRVHFTPTWLKYMMQDQGYKMLFNAAALLGATALCEAILTSVVQKATQLAETNNYTRADRSHVLQAVAEDAQLYAWLGRPALDVDGVAAAREKSSKQKVHTRRRDEREEDL